MYIQDLYYIWGHILQQLGTIKLQHLGTFTTFQAANNIQIYDS